MSLLRRISGYREMLEPLLRYVHEKGELVPHITAIIDSYYERERQRLADDPLPYVMHRIGVDANSILHQLLGQLANEHLLQLSIEVVTGHMKTIIASSYEHDRQKMMEDPVAWTLQSHPHFGRISRNAIERINAAGQLKPRLEELIAQDTVATNISEADRERLRSDPVEFLFSNPSQARVTGSRPVEELSSDLSEEDLRARIQRRLVANLDADLAYDIHNLDPIRLAIKSGFDDIVNEADLTLTEELRTTLLEDIEADILGLGPIESALQDPEVSEIMVLGPKTILVTRHGVMEQSHKSFDNDEHVMRIIDRIVAPLAKRCDEGTPFVEGRLADGTRFATAIRPISSVGPVIALFKPNRVQPTVDEVVAAGTVTQDAMTFLQASVQSGMSVLISGMDGSGRTTLLNLLVEAIPEQAFTTVIEAAPNLKLSSKNMLRLVERSANIHGYGQVTRRELLSKSTWMRPQRVVLDEVSGAEAVDLLRLRTPWMTIIRAHDPHQALEELEWLYLLDDGQRPAPAVRSRIAREIDLLIHMENHRNQPPIVSGIYEVGKLVDESVTLTSLFARVDASSELVVSNRPSRDLMARLTGRSVDDEVEDAIRSLYAD